MASLNTIASIIQNAINGGNGIVNERISFEQLKDEVVQTRIRLIAEAKAKGAFVDNTNLYQWIREIPLEKASITDFSPVEDISKVKGFVYFCEIPVILKLNGQLMVSYIGATNMKSTLRFIEGNRITTALHDRMTGHLPFAWFTDNKLVVVNYDKPLSSLSIEAIFTDPRDLMQYDGGSYKSDDDEFPLGASLQDITTGKIAASYLREYVAKPPTQPNHQVDRT